MSLPLFEHLDSVAAQLQAAGHVLLGLDYDGTLTPLVNNPADALLDPEVRALLRRLAARPLTSLAVVSGRRLTDVRHRVAVDGLIYVGNHGLEIAGPGFSFVEPRALTTSSALACLAPALDRELAAIAGVILENKSLTIAIHHRQAAHADKELVFRHVQAAVAVLPEAFRIGYGHDVFEIRPRCDWHKGRALRWIEEQLGKPAALTIYVGDDATDEDAFRELADAVTIRVGRPESTCARFHVEDTGGVVRFLNWIAHPAKEVHGE